MIRPKANARFGAQREDVLEAHQRPYDPKRPVVCLDEACKQRTSSVQESLSLAPGKPERIDDDYERHAQATMFMLFAPLEAWRNGQVRHTRNAT